jgi:proteasome lid subunit RPN8/RPN11
MKPGKRKTAAKKVDAPAAAEGRRIEFDSEVLRQIRRHARSSMSAEICGVLVGAARGKTTAVEACIQGEEARQGGSHVTFTQETWTHIYQVKDARYPDHRIVGWYHSHPGFGVFLSEHDLFIHRNFFSDPNQVAWVFDPHSEEEGCFSWEKDEIVRVREISVRDQPGRSAPVQEPAGNEFASVGSKEFAGEEPSGRSRIARWVGLTLTHIFALILGFGIGALLFPPVIVMPARPAQRPSSATPLPPAAPAVAQPAGPHAERKP